MNTSYSRLRIVFLTSVLAFLFSVSFMRAADDGQMGAHAFSIDVPADKVAVAQLHDMVIAASAKRQWIVKLDTAEKISVYLNHRKVEATVTYVLSEKHVHAYCDSYALNGQGGRIGPKQPTKWLDNLKSDITTLINMAPITEKK